MSDLVDRIHWWQKPLWRLARRSPQERHHELEVRQSNGRQANCEVAV
jgi:hypothetical protein